MFYFLPPMLWMVDDPDVLKVDCGLVPGEHVGGHVFSKAKHHSNLLVSYDLADEKIPNVNVLVLP